VMATAWPANRQRAAFPVDVRLFSESSQIHQPFVPLEAA
jgi:hypothetical protein